ncbi:MAG: ABC transporter permease [bacterium]|nr:ABC transporter permease [bacterium]
MTTNKIGVIISHEYLSRVKAKWFLLTTLLAPLALVVMVMIPVLAAVLAGDGNEGKVAVMDRTGILADKVVNTDTSVYIHAGSATEAQLKEKVKGMVLQAYVVIPADVLDSGRVLMYSRGGSGFSFEKSVSRTIEPFVVKARLLRAGTDTSVIRLVEDGIAVQSLKITEQGLEEDRSGASAAIGYGAGIVIYMLIFLYGSMVMRGVVEEKANRIVEVLASSARPFQIMMGKVIGIGLVGLTQLTLWFILGTVALLALATLIPGTSSADTVAQLQQMQQMQQQMPMATPAQGMQIGEVSLPSIPPLFFVLFLFYFLVGYFIYATFYAAVGSAVDQEADANSIAFPIALPVILCLLFIGNVLASPNGTTAVVLSLIPLFTPILMTVRIAATDVPAWQILLSIVLTTGTFFGAVWVASRIYRIGILSYGKAPTFKQIFKWIRFNA